MIMVIMMNKCNKCNVYINTKTSKCPLCGCNINSSKGENVFPHINYLFCFDIIESLFLFVNSIKASYILIIAVDSSKRETLFFIEKFLKNLSIVVL